MTTLSDITALLTGKATIENCRQAIKDANDREAQIVEEINDIMARLNSRDVPESHQLVEQMHHQRELLQQERGKVAEARSFAQRKQNQLLQANGIDKAKQQLKALPALLTKAEKAKQQYDAAMSELQAADSEFVTQRRNATGVGLGLQPTTDKLPATTVTVFENIQKVLAEAAGREYNENSEATWQAARSHGLDWQREMDKRRGGPRMVTMDGKPSQRRPSEYLAKM